MDRRELRGRNDAGHTIHHRFIALALTAGQVAAPPSAIALAAPATPAVLPDLGMLAPKDFSIAAMSMDR